MNTIPPNGFLLVVVVLVVGCAQTKLPEPPPPEAVAIAQIGYGPAAKFVTCTFSGCSGPTRKTLPEPNPPPKAVSVAAKPPPPEAPPAPEVEPAPPKRVIINFTSRSASLSNEAKRQLDRLAPHVTLVERVFIKGRTDAQGDAAANDRLALRRAMAVRTYLRRANSGNKAFVIIAKGGCCYVARNDTDDGRAANRRVEIEIGLPSHPFVLPRRSAPSKAEPS